MSTINKLQFVPIIAPETQPQENTKQPTAQLAVGIASIADGFESAKPSTNEIFTMIQPQTQFNSDQLTSAGDQSPVVRNEANEIGQNGEQSTMEKMRRTIENINRLFSNLSEKLTSSLK